MNRILKSCVLLGALLLSGSIYAGGLKVEGAWSRATAPGQDVAMVDLSITSDQQARLVGISTPVCKTVEIHSMSHENGMMKMREVQFVELPAGKRVNLGESGYHLMLIGLKSPLRAGDSIALTLDISGVDKVITKVEAKAQVRSLNEAAPAEGHMHHMH